MKGQSATLILVALVLALTTVGCAPNVALTPLAAPATTAPAFPVGTFTRGTWVWEFRADGTEAASEYQYDGDSLHATLWEDGTYSVTGSQVVFVDTKNVYCGSEAKGIYSWTFDGQALSFKVISDPCSGRQGSVERAEFVKRPDLSGFIPTGTYRAIDNTAGEFFLELKADGAFTISTNAGHEGQPQKSSGTFYVSQNRVRFTGSLCDSGDKASGTYAWTFDGSKLYLTSSDDKCPDRWRVLNLIWTKQ